MSAWNAEQQSCNSMLRCNQQLSCNPALHKGWHLMIIQHIECGTVHARSGQVEDRRLLLYAASNAGKIVLFELHSSVEDTRRVAGYKFAGTNVLVSVSYPCTT